METIEEQFDEKFPSGVFNFYYKIQYIKKVKEIKQFYSSKISKLLGDLVGEVDIVLRGVLLNGFIQGQTKEKLNSKDVLEFAVESIKNKIKASEFNEFLTSGKR